MARKSIALEEIDKVEPLRETLALYSSSEYIQLGRSRALEMIDRFRAWAEVANQAEEAQLRELYVREEEDEYRLSPAKFPVGQLVATPNAIANLTVLDIRRGLGRHLRGDWGEVDEEDRAENELSLANGFRLFSVYLAEDGTKFWIITEADRSATTVLLPEDY